MAKMYSILQLKSNAGNEQKVVFELEPNTAWIETTPHKFEGIVNFNGSAVMQNDVVEVQADIQVPIKFICDKCGLPFTKNLNAKTAATYDEISEFDDPTDIELEYKIQSNRIDLEPLIRDAIIENMPSKVLCKEDCKGLCPHCGENLNISECRCKKI